MSIEIISYSILFEEFRSKFSCFTHDNRKIHRCLKLVDKLEEATLLTIKTIKNATLTQANSTTLFRPELL